MSAATKANVDSAIREHLADEGQGDVLTAWVLVSSSTTLADDDAGTIWIESPDGQQRFATLGLLESGKIMTRGYVYAAMTKDLMEDGGA